MKIKFDDSKLIDGSVVNIQVIIRNRVKKRRNNRDFTIGQNRRNFNRPFIRRSIKTIYFFCTRTQTRYYDLRYVLLERNRFRNLNSVDRQESTTNTQAKSSSERQKSDNRVSIVRTSTPEKKNGTVDQRVGYLLSPILSASRTRIRSVIVVPRHQNEKINLNYEPNSRDPLDVSK